MSTKSRVLVILLGAVALIFVILALQLLYPGTVTLHATSGDAVITFSADRRLVAAPGGCVTVNWQVDHIKAVFINSLPTIGEGSQNVCVTETAMPVLHIQFEDNTEQDYILQIDFLIFQPSTWLLIAAAVLLGLTSLYVALVRPSAASPQTGVRRTPRLVLIFAGIGLLLTGLLLTVLILELGLRFYFTNYGTSFERTAYLDSRAEIEAASATIPLPQVEYGLTPGYPGQNALGYRGDEISVPKPPEVFRIVVSGGSSIYGTTNPYNETAPYYLQQVLHDDYGATNVEVINDGVSGYTSWNNLVDLSTRVLALQPDLVIVYPGANDIGPREVPSECYSGESPFLGLDPRRRLRAEPDELSPSVLYRFIAINLGWMENPADVGGGFADSHLGCGTQAEYDEIAHNVEVNRPIYYERNLRNMIGIARANGFLIMFATCAYDHNSPYALPYWRTALAEHNAITTQIAQENGALFLDYTTIAPTDKSYWSDSIHMTSKGNLSFAQTFAQFLIDQGVIPLPNQ